MLYQISYQEVSVFVEFSFFYRVGMSICKEQIGDKILVKIAYSEVTYSGFRNAVTNKRTVVFLS